MPIRKGDGTGISDLRLGDGTGIAELRKGDGTVLWSRAPDIPDSVVSRPQDNNSFTDNGREWGIEISTSQYWESIGARISANAANFTDAYIRETDETLIKNVDISNLSSGDSFTFDDVNLTANTNYLITVARADGNSFTSGYYDAPSFPYVSSDGNLEIVAGAQVGSGTTFAPINIVEVGNVGFV